MTKLLLNNWTLQEFISDKLFATEIVQMNVDTNNYRFSLIMRLWRRFKFSLVVRKTLLAIAVENKMKISWK